MSTGMDAKFDRVREVVRRCKAGEGVVKWHFPHFIQLQPDKHLHLNFFGSPLHELPKNLGSPTHTHDYGFTSHILSGRINNVRSQVAPTLDGEYFRYVVDDEDWTRYIQFRATDERMTVIRSVHESYGPSEVYEMDPREWHATRFDEPTITLLDMWDHAPLDYFVLVRPEQAQHFNIADRRVSADRMESLWLQVEANLAHAGITL
jgi:hypothetical protein